MQAVVIVVIGPQAWRESASSVVFDGFQNTSFSSEVFRTQHSAVVFLKCFMSFSNSGLMDGR